MNQHSRKLIFLADDDEDDCLLFGDALREVNAHTCLTTAADGFQLMSILHETVPPPPDVIFLDLNMPRKNGFECLAEIKQVQKLKDIPVIIYSTSAQQKDIEKVYEQGARYYLCKPDSFEELKKAITKVLSIDWRQQTAQPGIDGFCIAV